MMVMRRWISSLSFMTSSILNNSYNDNIIKDNDADDAMDVICVFCGLLNHKQW